MSWVRIVRTRRIEALRRAFEETMQDPLLRHINGFLLAMVDDDACRAWNDEWAPTEDRPHQDGGWDWPAIHGQTQYKKAKFCIALWHGKTTLSGLTLVSVARRAVRIEIVEGNPRSNHPLKGSVLPILLDTVARFGQQLGRAELRLMNPVKGMVRVYCEVYNFELVALPKGRRMCRREI